MSRIVTHNESWSGYPTSYLSDHQYYGASNQNNALASTTSTTYANINLTRGSSAETYWYVAFDTSAIPQNATITSCSGKSKCVMSSIRSNYIKTRQTRFYSGTNPKGNAITLSTSSDVTNVTVGTWTREELNDVRIRYYAMRNSGSTNSSIYIRPYGSEFYVNYTWDETFYSVSTSSSAQGVGISASNLTASGDTLSGNSSVITLTGVSSLSNIIVKDNGTDITASFTASGNNYIYTLSNISADHTLTVEAKATPTGKASYIKSGSTFASVSQVKVKGSGSCGNKTINSIFWKINGIWSQASGTNSGTTATKTIEI